MGQYMSVLGTCEGQTILKEQPIWYVYLKHSQIDKPQVWTMWSTPMLLNCIKQQHYIPPQFISNKGFTICGVIV
jgi:hypothetical protein